MKSLLGKFVVIGLIIFGFFLVSLANAEVTLKDYKSVKDTQIFKTYISGVAVGFLWANVEIKRIGKPPLYCQPGKLAINVDNILRILGDFIDRKKDQLEPEYPVEMLLLHALQETFPCNK